MTLAIESTPVKELNELELALLSELQAAHLIINNAENVMTLAQKLMWQGRNRNQNLIDTDATRIFERLQVFEMANKKVAP